MIPSFPRIPRLMDVNASGGDDIIVASLLAALLMDAEVIVEEKLDGANASVFFSQDGGLEAFGRAGPGARDRAGQFGRLRAWAAERRTSLARLLDAGEVLFGEWLYLRHSVAYDHLPDLFVAFDIWHVDSGFVAVDERDRRCSANGIATVPVLYQGRVGSTKRLEALVRRSRYGIGAAEGVILRREERGRLIHRAKWINPSFVRRTDEDWRGAQQFNRVAG